MKTFEIYNYIYSPNLTFIYDFLWCTIFKCKSKTVIKISKYEKTIRCIPQISTASQSNIHSQKNKAVREDSHVYNVFVKLCYTVLSSQCKMMKYSIKILSYI